MKFFTFAAALVTVVSATTQAGLRHKQEEKQRSRRMLIEGGRRIQYVDEVQRCNSSPWGSPCGPESVCEDTDTGYICTNPYVYGCPAGCTQHAECIKGDDNLYACVCDPGFFQPEPWMPCREA